MPPKFTPNIQWTLLKKKDPNLKQIYLRDYNPLRYGIPAQFQFNLKGFVDQVLITPHLHLHYYREFSLFYTVFARCYSRYRNCFLFLRLLRCFNSAGSRSHKGAFPKE